MSTGLIPAINWVALCTALLTTPFSSKLLAGSSAIDLSNAVVVISSGERGQAEKMASTILVEEVHRRTGIQLAVQDHWPNKQMPVMAITTRSSNASWAGQIPQETGHSKPEGYSIRCGTGKERRRHEVFVVGNDSRGAMFGVGRLLRELHLSTGKIELPGAVEIETAPEYPTRGHEMGYRPRANSYDAWTPEQYDRYIREQVVFGMNCMQNIPFEDTRGSKVMQVARDEMNRKIGEICARYDIDYWVWTPVEFSLTDEAKRSEELKRHEEFYGATPRLNAVFVPGGDPGDNPPELVLPFLKDLALRLHQHHPDAKVWMSLQDFDAEKVRYVMDFLSKTSPDWFGGIVADTSALPIAETRRRLSEKYPVQWYPDIAHTVQCQFPVEWWDPAFALTLGREPTNPRPTSFATTFRRFAPDTHGFVSYSDGINDDANKAIWSMLGWDSQQDVREMLVQYARFHFGADVAERGADGLLGLENNWRGSLAENAGVDGVLSLWQSLESDSPKLLQNWRFQQNLMRAYYDAYTRHRLIYESRLEREAMLVLRNAPTVGADAAMMTAEGVLYQAVEQPVRPELKKRVITLADALYESIGYQTSVKRYHASGAERGCVMDFVDRPLNDRWWFNDELERIRGFASESKKQSRLKVVRTWKNPGSGSYYDDIGHVGQSPRVIRGEGMNTDPERRRHANPGHSWEADGNSRMRLSWLHALRWPVAVDYDGLNPKARYVVRVGGRGTQLLRGDGERLEKLAGSDQSERFQQFQVPQKLITDGSLKLTWDDVDDSHIHWSKRGHVAEVWLLNMDE